MPASDILKSFRGSQGSISDAGKTEKGMDSGEKNATSRIIKLTDDEQKLFAQAKPGEDLACEVHGGLEEDGHFHIMSVAPLGGSSYGDENKMAGEVARKVAPGIPV